MRIDDLGAMFARAPFQEAGWDKALKALAGSTGSSRAQLIAIGERHALFNWVTDIEEGYVEDFAAIDGHRPDVNYRVGASRGPYELVWEHHYDAVRAAAPNDAYMQHVRRWDAEHGAQLVLADQPGAFFGLAALHSASDGRTTEAQRQALLDAAPHVMAAIRLQRAVEHRGAALLRGSLDALRAAAILLDATGRVCAVTDRARALLGPGTLQVRGGRLQAARPERDGALQLRLAAALASPSAMPDEIWLQGPAGPLLVEICALPRQDWNFGFAPGVIVTLKAPTPPPEDQGARLSMALGLTPAEGEIVSLLAQGRSRRDVAAIRGVSVQTVATQLRTIFHKAGVNREAELVAVARAVVELASR
ncbi:helix-turn-helix transcriptional regulator [Novosphingobium sp. FGD1]|jgi:DNA-binding CsgD family transcriptional regulator|uniref:Helix-turn-helix transcriptional regulator n=1 Tax=Novosphingobium silvae TaxID=2692619 RepID=A0A7X4K6W6_9SPHN|nr:helix-turn-helix transcriptional regulator [Novosphingobium silvae]MYL97555.1 helix-turn-helix transcriptional regulator [Novosphingobium silvae]